MNRHTKKWKEVELGDHVYIAGRIGWRGLKANEYTQTGPLLLSVPNLNYGEAVDFSVVNHISQERYDESPEITLQVGDTLLVKDGAGIGKLGYVEHLPAPATVNSSLLVVRPKDEMLLPKYLYWYLKGPDFQNLALQRITGSATPHLFQKDIKQLRVIVPPAVDQRRVIALLDSLVPRVRRLGQRLALIPSIMNQFRQSALASACSGRLTADWRKESFAVSEPETTVPAGWEAVTVGDVIKSLKYGTSKKCHYNKVGVPVLRIPNVVKGFVDYSDLKYADLPSKEISQLRLIPGDILLIRSNGSVSLVGRTALVQENEMELAYAGYLIRIRPNQDRVDPEYLNLALRSYGVRAQIELQARSTSGVNNINTAEIQRLKFLLPPLSEQRVIVQRAKEMLVNADQIESRCKAVQKRLDILAPAILAKVFRGEIVAPDSAFAEASA